MLSRVVGVAYSAAEGSGCFPRASVLVRQAMEGRCSQREVTIPRRYRQHEGSARVSEGLRLCSKSAEGMYPDGPEVGGAVSWIGR